MIIQLYIKNSNFRVARVILTSCFMQEILLTFYSYERVNKTDSFKPFSCNRPLVSRIFEMVVSMRYAIQM